MNFDNDDKISRRVFLQLSGILGCGIACPGFVMNDINKVEWTNMSNKHLKWWLNTFMKNLQSDNEKSGMEILEECGRACARHHLGKKLNDLKKQIKDLNDIDSAVDFMNKNHLGSGKIRREGNYIYDSYPKCYCPTMSSGIIESPVFCNCTLGFNKEIFETVLGKPVQVEIEKSVARGDDCCLIKVSLN